MRKITLDELYNIASQSREKLFKQAESVGREPKIYLHWTAGKYYTTFKDYHINITGNGDIFLMDDLTAKLDHTYMRNTGAVGVTLCCAYEASPRKSLGLYPPTKKQIETMAQVVQRLADGLWLTIDKKHVLTHGEAGDNEDGEYYHDDYGPKTTCERWDLEVLGISQPAHDRCDTFDPWGRITGNHRGGDILRGKANWYRKKAEQAKK